MDSADAGAAADPRRPAMRRRRARPRPPARARKLRPIGTVEGAPLGYFEYLPPDYGKQPSPLLVFFHGSGESGAGDEGSLAKLASAGIP